MIVREADHVNDIQPVSAAAWQGLRAMASQLSVVKGAGEEKRALKYLVL